MCEDRPDQYWRGVGVSSNNGTHFVLEQCMVCGTYRTRILDQIEELPGLVGLPSFEEPALNDEQQPEPDSDGDGTRDDWLVDE